MSLYNLALFLHVSGAIGAFVSIGIWLFGLSALRRAQRVEQVRAIAWLIIVASPLMVFSVLLIAIAGLDMALSTWGLRTPWIGVAIVSFVLIAPVGPFVLYYPMQAILAEVREVPGGPIPDTLYVRTHNPILGTAAQTMTAILLGIVFLMTNKPELVTSIIVMGIALACGLLSGVPYWYAARRLSRRLYASETPLGEDPFLKKTIWTRRW
ncbi:MAG TPA: DUF2269 family protein [Ktedonobacteraceae bacterium]